MKQEEFFDFLEECYLEMLQKQDNLIKDYNITEYDEYWYNQRRKVLQFKNNDIVQLEFSTIFIGTWAHKKNTWLWAWANSGMTEEIREDSEQIKELANLTGNDIFIEPHFQCDEEMAYEITALAVHQLNALGVYRVPGELSNLFIAIMKKNEI
ncbi:hypothetical protein KQI86_05295 [Clostridium sp. MSJ-11]|uniref:Uncharacterized protein n=1 Tax=Clostridium mobile TaxID=2841512 RepID=A0ABS6EEU8_9CLOT|nr:DUF6882 domain-containing protein [Clostridium mobile]MBU5483737.1 hypothetical protein [Clostridium mobile]